MAESKPTVTKKHQEAAARVLDYYTDQPLSDRIALAIAYAEQRGAKNALATLKPKKKKASKRHG